MFVDPHAAEVVFKSGAPIVMMPLDVTHQVLRNTHPKVGHGLDDLADTVHMTLHEVATEAILQLHRRRGCC